MPRHCFHLSVSSPGNDYGPDFLLVDLDQAEVRHIRALWAVLQATDADGVMLRDDRPDWYLGDPEYAAEEIFAAGPDFNLAAFLDTAFTLVNVQGSRMLIGRDAVFWESESHGGDLFRSEPIPIKLLVHGVGLVEVSSSSSPLDRLVELINQGMEFPDALWRAIREFGMPGPEAEDLKQRYDLACAGHACMTAGRTRANDPSIVVLPRRGTDALGGRVTSPLFRRSP